MVETKKLNIKNRAYYFFDDMIDIKNFHSNLLKIDKKSHKDTDIYYIGYITIKKFDDCENIQCNTVVFNNSFCYRTKKKTKQKTAKNT